MGVRPCGILGRSVTDVTRRAADAQGRAAELRRVDVGHSVGVTPSGSVGRSVGNGLEVTS
jgi:hypothetical protein